MGSKFPEFAAGGPHAGRPVAAPEQSNLYRFQLQNQHHHHHNHCRRHRTTRLVPRCFGLSATVLRPIGLAFSFSALDRCGLPVCATVLRPPFGRPRVKTRHANQCGLQVPPGTHSPSLRSRSGIQWCRWTERATRHDVGGRCGVIPSPPAPSTTPPGGWCVVGLGCVVKGECAARSTAAPVS